MRSEIWRFSCCWVWRVRKRDARWRASRCVVRDLVREFGGGEVVEVVDVDDSDVVDKGFALISCLILQIRMLQWMFCSSLHMNICVFRHCWWKN